MDIKSLDQERLFRTLLDNLADGVYFTDRDRCIQYWNRGAEQITGFSTDEVVGRRCSDNILMHVDELGQQLCIGRCPLSFTMEDGVQRHAKFYLHHKEGHRVPVHVSTAPIYDEGGSIIGALETFHDISAELAALKEVEALRKQSLLCPLTGVGNRRYCEEMLQKRLDEMKRSGGTLAVFFLDVDRFKEVNDTWGHDVGDMVLRMIARTLSGSMRTYDFLGRWGGEEFLALAPNLPPDEREDFANRLRVLVSKSSRTVSDMNLTVTVSVGAVIAQPGESMNDVVVRADRLMYRSKDGGRNRVTVSV